MPTISLCMIVKNEEDVLARCLDSAAGLMDEIIIVDTGSSDRTIEIAERYTEKVYSFEWIDDFSAARNFAFSKATMDYCMWLDADDIIETKQHRAFLKLKKTLTDDIDFVMMKYNIAFDEHGLPTFSYYRERWIKNNGMHIWQGAVHEAIVPAGKVLHSDIEICHKKIHAGDSDRNLNIYRKMIAEHQVLEPRHRYYYARELYYHNLHQEAFEEFSTFLMMKDGWIENKIEACTMCAYCCYMLGKQDDALMMLFKSFEYDLPRAEVCCDIGKHFLDRQKYNIAAYWYQRALACSKLPGEGFIQLDCYDYIPYLQLCVCYDRMGDLKEARKYNEKAGQVKPGSKAYLLNKQYFKA